MKQNMKVIITGGTGLIGQALAADLAADGHEVILLSRSKGAIAGLSPTIRVEKWDGRTAAGWGHLVDGADAIVNLAGANISAGRWTAKRKQEILQSRQNAGAAVVQAVQQAQNKPAVVIQAAAIGFYGPSETKFFTEANGPGDDFLAQVCQAWEASTLPVEDLGVRRVVARLAVVLSNRIWRTAAHAAAFQVFRRRAAGFWKAMDVMGAHRRYGGSTAFLNRYIPGRGCLQYLCHTAHQPAVCQNYRDGYAPTFIHPGACLCIQAAVWRDEHRIAGRTACLFQAPDGPGV